MRYDQIKDLAAEKFRRLTGIKRATFDKMVGILMEADLKEPTDIEQEMEDVELEATDDDDVEDAASEFDGWIYAFSFPILVQANEPFPIKIGKTIKDVEDRVSYQCKGSASFDNPIILGRWQVSRVSTVETAIHATLKSRGKWRENVPGTEWFNTTISEIQSIVEFIHPQFNIR